MTNTDLRPPSEVVAPDPPAGGYAADEVYEEPAPWRPVQYPALRFAALLGALTAIGFLAPWVLVVILGLVFMIFMHELGHYIMARRADMKVTEFFIGFGPRIWSFKRGEVEYGLKVIPAGAYVKIIGMTNLEEVPPEDEPRAYRQKTFSQRVKVAVAGSAMHFMMAFVLIFLLLTTVGVPGGRIDVADSNWKVGRVFANSAANDAGLRQGDKILTVGGKKVGSFDSLPDIVGPMKNKTVVLRFQRGTTIITKQVRPREYDAVIGGTSHKGSCCLGLQEYRPPTATVSPVAAVPATVRGFVGIGQASVAGFLHLFSPSGISGFAHQVANANDQPAKSTSPGSASSSSGSTTSQQDLKDRPVSIVGIVNVGSQIGANGVAGLLGFFALVNIFIGLFNLIPLLPFDGGHVAVAVYERIQEKRLHRKRRYFVDAAKLLPLTYVVVGILGLLFVSTMYLDILNPIKT